MGEVIQLRVRQPVPVVNTPRARREALRKQAQEAALRQTQMMLGAAATTTALLMLALGLLARV